jgi:hypothetical protein
MRIVCWNFQGSSDGATPHDQARCWHHLAALDADLALLQEVSHSAIPDWVADEWTVCAGQVGRYGKESAWGSVIAARSALNLRLRDELLDTEGSWLAVLYDYVLVAEVDLDPTTTALVGSVHAPAISAAELMENLDEVGAIPDEELSDVAIQPDEPWATDVIFHALDEARDERFIIGGDWSTSRLFDRNKSVPTNALFFARACQRGWVETMAGRDEQQSFFRIGNLPYHLDHLFTDATTNEAVTSGSIWADPSALEISDHAPVVIDLDLGTS